MYLVGSLSSTPKPKPTYFEYFADDCNRFINLNQIVTVNFLPVPDPLEPFSVEVKMTNPNTKHTFRCKSKESATDFINTLLQLNDGAEFVTSESANSLFASQPFHYSLDKACPFPKDDKFFVPLSVNLSAGSS